MSLTAALYLVNLVSNIDFVLGLFFTVIFIASGISFFFVFTAEEYNDHEQTQVRRAKKVISKAWIGVVLISISALIPCKNTMYLMLGSSYLEQSNLPSKVSTALELKLDGYISELKKEVVK